MDSDAEYARQMQLEWQRLDAIPVEDSVEEKFKIRNFHSNSIPNRHFLYSKLKKKRFRYHHRDPHMPSG